MTPRERQFQFSVPGKTQPLQVSYGFKNVRGAKKTCFTIETHI